MAYEIKKEIADRYFGFRKLIEDDKTDLTEKIKQHSFIIEKRISFDLIRIYILLKAEDLIHIFLDVAGLEEKLFYDSYLTESSVIKDRVFEGVRLRGLTRTGCFKNMVFDGYERLETHVDQYREKFEELMDLQDTINEEIKLFYRNNDLGTIMGFLRSLGDSSVCGAMEGGMEVGMAMGLEEKMRIEKPLPIEHYLPVIPPLVPLETIRGEMKKLTDRAYTLHDETFQQVFVKGGFRLWR
jgi:hypothetical protein